MKERIKAKKRKSNRKFATREKNQQLKGFFREKFCEDILELGKSPLGSVNAVCYIKVA